MFMHLPLPLILVVWLSSSRVRFHLPPETVLPAQWPKQDGSLPRLLLGLTSVQTNLDMSDSVTSQSLTVHSVHCDESIKYYQTYRQQTRSSNIKPIHNDRRMTTDFVAGCHTWTHNIGLSRNVPDLRSQARLVTNFHCS